MYQNSVLGNFLWRSGAESFAWCTYNILVQGGGGLPPPVGGSVGGRGRQRPPPKETPCSCTSRACTMYIHCTHLPGAMAMCQFKLHIRDNFFSRTLCSKSDFFSFMTKSSLTVANMFLSINISNSDNLNSTTSSFKLASAKARVTSVKSTKQQLVSELVSH